MDVATLSMMVDTRQVRAATTHLDRFSGSGQRAARSATTTEKATAVMGGAMARAARQIATAAGALVSVGAAFRSSQQYTQMTNSLRSLGMSADQASSTLGQIADVANRTRAPLEATAQLYQRISIAGRDLGATQQQVLRFSENVGLALAQTGTSASQASGALLQLSQAMAGGVVRAEEFNSILEGAFPIAQAAADGIDEAAGSVGRLRQMVIEGKVSSDEFFQAILSQTDQLEEAFARTVPTIGGAMTVLNNQWTMFVGGVNNATGVADAAARVIILAADNLERLVFWAGAAATAFGVRYVAGLVAAAKATTTLSATLTVLRGALIRTGIGALIVGAGELVYQFGRLVDATGGFGAAMSALGEVAKSVWQGILESAKALGPALDGLWQRIKSGFLTMTADMLWGWRDLLQSMADSANGLADLEVFGVRPFEDMSNRIQDAANNVAEASNDILESGNAADRQSRQSFESASGAISGAFSDAREAAAALAAEVADANGGPEGGGAAALSRLQEALEDIGGGAGGGGAAKAAQDALDRMGRAAGDAAASGIDRLDQGLKSVSDAMAGAIVQGKSMGAALSRVFGQIATDLFSSGIHQFLGGDSSGDGSSGGGRKGLLGMGNFLGFLDGGGNIGAGQFAIAGERRPELVTGPSIVRGPASVVGGAETARMMQGAGGRSEVVIRLDDGLRAEILEQAGEQTVQIVSAAGQAQRRSFGGQIEQYQDRGTSG